MSVTVADEWVPEAQDDYSYTGYIVCADIARAALTGKPAGLDREATPAPKEEEGNNG